MKLWQRLKENNPFRFPEHKRSRAFFTFEGTFATILGVLASGAILAGFLEYIGIPERYNGIILAIPIMTSILQPFGAYLFEGLQRKKPLFLGILAVHRSLLAIMFLVPVFIANPTVRAIALVSIFSISSLLVALPTVAASNWIFHLTSDYNRAKYLAIRERTMIFVSAVFALFSGWVIDHFKSIGDLNTGYIVIFIIAAVSMLGNAFSITQIKEPESMSVVSSPRRKLLASLILPFKDKGFRPIILIMVLYQISIQLFAPYWGIYQVNALNLPYTYLMALAFFGSVEKTIVVSFWARLSSRTNWVYCTMLALAIMAFSNVLNVFTVPKTAYVMTIIPSIVGQLSWAALNMCFFNIQFENAPKENRMLYVGATAAVSSLFGFAGVLFAGYLMSFAEQQGWVFLDAPFRGQQMQLIISSVMLLFTVWYIYRTFKKRGVPVKFKLWERN